MRVLLAILTGKILSYLIRQLKIGGGTAAPGLYALKLDPDLVRKLSRQIPKNVVITGTNGKTTTARMLAHFAKEAGLKVIRNHTGSNLERGIASALISNYQLPTAPPGARNQLDLGIWELDEAAFNTVAPKLKPEIVVFLNISRDQLDRYGEIDKVVSDWCNTVAKLNSKTIVLINADNPNLEKLEKYFRGKVVKFGKKNIKNIKQNGLEGSSFELKILNFKLKINLSLPGLYHIYNAVAALVMAHYLGLPTHKSFQDFQPAFGRFEKLPFGYIFLIKNPAGATQVFETIAPQLKKNDRLLLALNDNLADGTDVSWIWDGEFEKLLVPSLRAMYRSGTWRGNLIKKIASSKTPRNDVIVSGTRAADLAVRLKYAGFNPKQIHIEPSLKKALKQARKGLKGSLFILPTYTAMLEIQRILAKIGIKKEYWNE